MGLVGSCSDSAQQASGVHPWPQNVFVETPASSSPLQASPTESSPAHHNAKYMDLTASLDQMVDLVVLNVPVDIPSASVTPAGGVVILSGIFATAETDDEIAAFLSHEVAHVLARHVEARISGNLMVGLAMTPALPFVIGSQLVGELYLIAAPFVAIGSIVMLALCREQETEADEMGMLLMTEAGFNPAATALFWRKMDRAEQKMRQNRGIKAKAEYNSTHPHSISRIEHAANRVYNTLYITGKAPFPKGLKSGKARGLWEYRQRWERFLQERPTKDIAIAE
ncbi:MAG: hypothetical protein Q9181_001379 [Wetmoreana brouardii]